MAASLYVAVGTCERLLLLVLIEAAAAAIYFRDPLLIRYIPIYLPIVEYEGRHSHTHTSINMHLYII